MKMTLTQALDMIDHGETPEEYRKRQARIRNYTIERDFLLDALEILTEPEDEPQRRSKQRRLAAVLETLETLI